MSLQVELEFAIKEAHRHGRNFQCLRLRCSPEADSSVWRIAFEIAVLVHICAALRLRCVKLGSLWELPCAKPLHLCTILDGTMMFIQTSSSAIVQQQPKSYIKIQTHRRPTKGYPELLWALFGLGMGS